VTDFRSPQCQLSRKLSSGIGADICRQTDVTKLIGAFRGHGKASKIKQISLQWNVLLVKKIAVSAVGQNC